MDGFFFIFFTTSMNFYTLLCGQSKRILTDLLLRKVKIDLILRNFMSHQILDFSTHKIQGAILDGQFCYKEPTKSNR